MNRKKRAAIFAEAMAALDQGDARPAMLASKKLLASSEKSSRVSGFLAAGFAYESGGSGVEVDLVKAKEHFRAVAVLAPGPIPFSCLARIAMKSGHDAYDEALHHLKAGEEHGGSIEITLGFAEYFLTKPCPDLNAAKRHFRKAAFRGRFQGFFGYSAAARMAGQPMRARFSDCCRILLGPALWLTLGYKAREHF